MPAGRPLPPGARCALHPERDARGVCPRCGNYSCESCIGSEPGSVCRSCEQRTGAGGFPFDRQNYSLDGLFGWSFQRWKKHWLPLAGVFVAFFVAVWSTSLFGRLVGVKAQRGTPFAMFLMPAFWSLQVGQILLQTALELPLLRLHLDIARGKPPSLAVAMRCLRRVPAALLQLLLIYSLMALYVGLVAALGFLVTGPFTLQGKGLAALLRVAAIGTLVGVGPAAYLGLGILFARIALVHDETASALEALRISMRVVAGQRWHVLGIALVAGIVALVGLFACGVGGLASLPLATLIHCSLFLALSNDRYRITTAR